MGKSSRPEVPVWMVEKVREVMDTLPRAEEQDAWTGVRWRVSGATIAHLFGGEDQRFRICFVGEPDDVVAFAHLGEPYYRAAWGSDMIGFILDENTDWDEVAESLIVSYCLMAPKKLAAEVRAARWTEPGGDAADI